MPIESRRIQYLVREPFDRDIRNLRGFVSPPGLISLRSKMNQGRIFIDGWHDAYKVPFGGVITLGASDRPLRVLGMRQRR